MRSFAWAVAACLAACGGAESSSRDAGLDAEDDATPDAERDASRDASEDAASEDAASEDAASEDAASEDAASEDAASDASTDTAVDSALPLGTPTRLHLQMDGAPLATVCLTGYVRTLDASSYVRVEAPIEIALGGHDSIQYYANIGGCVDEIESVVVETGESSAGFSFRVDAWGPMEAVASSAGLEDGVAEFAATAQASLAAHRMIVPTASCVAAPEVRMGVGPLDVPAAVDARFTLTAPTPFGGAPTSSGCADNQWDVTMAAGESRAAVFVRSFGTPGASQTLRLSPVLPPGAHLDTTPDALTATLFSECLPTGEACVDADPCCVGTCEDDVCP